MPKANFWEIKNATTKGEGELYLYGRIAGGSSWWSDVITPKQFKQDLDALGDISVLNVYINSGGGDVFAGQAIHTMLKRHKAHVNVYVDALAASIASVIAVAGDTVYVPANGMMMVHKAWTRVEGNADDMRKMADDLDKIGGTITAAYEEKCTISRAEIEALMTAETWLTAEECVAYGFADKITPAKQVAASINGDIITFSNQDMSIEKMQNVAQLLSKLPNATMATGIEQTKKKEENIPMDFNALFASLPADQQAMITAHLAASNETLTTQLAQAQADLGVAQAALAAVPAPVATLTDADFLASLPEAVRARYVADQEAASQALASAKVIQEAAETAKFVAQAKSYDKIPVKAEDFGKVLMAVSKAVPDAFAQISSVLGAVNAAMESNLIFKDLGSAGADTTGSPMEALDEKAAFIAKRDGITVEKAFVKACQENPDLYNNYQKELRGEE
jgi:ATP-dependent Clp protease protease subunit